MFDSHTQKEDPTQRRKSWKVCSASALQRLTYTVSLGHLTAATFTLPCVQVTMSRATGSLKGTVESGRRWRASCPTGTPTTHFHSKREKLGPTSCNLHAVLSQVWKSSFHLMETGDFRRVDGSFELLDEFLKYCLQTFILNYWIDSFVLVFLVFANQLKDFCFNKT